MMLLLALLPLSAFFVLFFVMIHRYPGQDWRQMYLRAAVLWGAYMVLETELLSFVRGITPLGLALAWVIPTVLGGGWLISRARHSTETQNVASLRFAAPARSAMLPQPAQGLPRQAPAPGG